MKTAFLLLFLAGGLLSCKEVSKKAGSTVQAPLETPSGTDTFVLENRVYSALAGGLSVREKPDANAAVIGKIEYGQPISTPPLPTDPAELPQNTSVPVTLGGMKTYWVKVLTGGKTGYVIDAYVSDYRPPAAGTKDLKGWSGTMSKPFEKPFVSRPKEQTLYQDGLGVYRQLYQNGVVYTQADGYEYFSTSLQLPGTTVLKVLNCLRGLEDFKAIFKSGAPLQKGSYTVADAEVPEGYQWETTYDLQGLYLQSVRISWSSGSYNTITLIQLETEVLVAYSSGV